MAWQGEVNKNIEVSWAASVMFYTKKALIDAGWELISAGDGVEVNMDYWGRGSGPYGNGVAGLPSSGAGGGGGTYSSNTSSRKDSGAGADGVVIFRYPISSGITATGGTVTDRTVSGVDYKVHRFTASGTFEVSSGSGEVEYLIAGGGGSGGLPGGGNGAQVEMGTVNVSQESYPVVVGTGGASRGGSSRLYPGYDGTPSSVFGIVAAGGVGGGTDTTTPNGAGVGSDGVLSDITGSPIFYGAAGGYGQNTGGYAGISGTQPWTKGFPNEDGSPLTEEQDPLDTITACDNVNAWFRIREPSISGQDPREFVFAKGSSGNSLLIKYSRSSGFSLSQSRPRSPITEVGGDGVVISRTTGTSTVTNASSEPAFNVQVNSSNKINVVVSDTPVFGAFPFYIWTYREGTGNCDCILLHEAVLPGTTSSLDQDPTYQVVATGDASLQFLRASVVTTGGYWEAYGLPNAAYRRGSIGYTTAYGSNYDPSGVSSIANAANASRIFPPVNILGPSPYSGQPITVPTLVGIGGQFPKGFSTGVMFGGFTAQNVLDTFNIDSLSPKIIAHYPNAREAIFLPWVPNVIPQV